MESKQIAAAVFVLIPALILYACEEKEIETENRMKALLITYSFLLPINLVYEQIENFADGSAGT